MEWLPALLGAAVGAAILAAAIAAAAFFARLVRDARRLSRFPANVALAYAANQVYCRLMQGIPFLKSEPLPPGPLIVVAPHRNSVDPFLLAASTRRQLHYMVAAEYAAIPLVGGYLRLVGCIPVDRSRADIGAVKAAMRYLKDGEAVGIFPEGGIRSAETGGHGRHGTAMLALKTGVPVIPAGIGGIIPTQNVALGLVLPNRAWVRFGPPVDLSDLRSAKPGHDQLEAATERIMAAIAAVSASPAPGPAAPPGEPGSLVTSL